jgi:hypothetical protein
LSSLPLHPQFIHNSSPIGPAFIDSWGGKRDGAPQRRSFEREVPGIPQAQDARYPAEQISGSAERLNTIVCLNSHNEKGELARRPMLFASAGRGQEGKKYENAKRVSIQFHVMFPKCKKVHVTDGALPGRLHVRGGRLRDGSEPQNYRI